MDLNAGAPDMHNMINAMEAQISITTTQKLRKVNHTWSKNGVNASIVWEPDVATKVFTQPKKDIQSLQSASLRKVNRTMRRSET